jgi:hypothetical protein
MMYWSASRMSSLFSAALLMTVSDDIEAIIAARFARRFRDFDLVVGIVVLVYQSRAGGRSACAKTTQRANGKREAGILGEEDLTI